MKLLKQLALSGASLLFCLILSEVALRVAVPQPPSWAPIFDKRAEDQVFGLGANLDIYADTGETQWSVYTDGDGLRVGEGGRRTSQAAQVLVLGDSFTFGYGVNYEQSFPARMDERANGDWHVINGGQPAYGPREYRLELERLLAVGYRPVKLILMLYVGNDIYDLLMDKSSIPVTDGVLGDGGGLKSLLSHNLHVYRLATKFYHSVLTPSAHFRHDDTASLEPDFWERPRIIKGYAMYKEELQRIAQICGRHGIEVSVGIIPATIAIDRRRGTTHAGTEHLQVDLSAKKFTATLDELAIPYVDLTDPLAAKPTRDTFLAFDGHFNETGNRMVADALYATYLSGTSK